MTRVRQSLDSSVSPRNVTGRKAAGRSALATKSSSRGQRSRSGDAQPGATSHVAQVRLQPDEMAALREVMRQRSLPSTSEALREGIRLLIREAAEVEAAEEILSFYGQRPAPLPDGVLPASADELAAADRVRW